MSGKPTQNLRPSIVTNLPNQTQPTATDDPTEKPKHFEFSLPQLAGGALAAVTAAALGSRLGVAGTLVGAALASVVAGVAGTLYTGSIKATSARVRRIWRTEDGTVVQEQVSPVSATGGRGRRGWWTVGGVVAGAVVSAVATFAIAMGIVTGAEMTSGQSLDGRTGTTLGRVSQPSASPSAKATETATPRLR